MIEVSGVTKRYGSTLAVDRLSFTVQPGVVTGFPRRRTSTSVGATRPTQSVARARWLS